MVEGARLGASQLYRTQVQPTGASLAVSVGKGNSVVVRQGSSAPGSERINLELNTQMVWAIDLRGGTSTTDLALADLALSSLTISGGAESMVLQLSRPGQPVPVLISGGATTISLQVAARVPVRLALDAGISRLDLNGSSSTANGSARVFSLGGCRATQAGYAISLTAGAASVHLTGG